MKLFKQLRFYLLILLAAMLAYFTYQINTFGLPNKYLILIALVFLTIFLLMVSICYQRSKIVKNIGIVLTIVCIACVGFGNNFALQTLDALKLMNENAENSNNSYYSVIINKIYDVENNESIPELKNMQNRKFGVLEMGNTAYNRDVISLVREEVGAKVDFVGIRTVEEATEKLQSGEIEIMIMNEAVRSLFDVELNSFSTVLKTYEFKNDKEIIRNPAKVTQEPFVVYVSGIDLFGDLSYVSRSDVNKLVVINPLSKDILMIDIPRDYYVPLSCFYDEYDKLTHTGIYGVDCTVQTISNFLDIDINYYARINFSTFVDIINAIGGVDIYIEEAFCASEDAGGICYAEGMNNLNGWQALCFARERQTLPGGDTDRIKNQSKLLAAMVSKVASPSILNNYSELLKILSKNIETNMSTNDMTSLVQMQLSDMASWNIESFALDGYSAYDMSAIMGQELYVYKPYYDSIDEAKELISDIMSRVY